MNQLHDTNAAAYRDVLNMDHRQIGQKLDLFTFHPLSPGNPIWLDKGTTIYNILVEKIRKINKENGYTEVRTPLIWKPELYHISGHLQHYGKNMFYATGQDCDEFVLKPMNCPGHMAIFKSKHWSYRDLPVRMSEFSPLHRNETSGAIGGLTRCRSFCQDDAHVFCAMNQLPTEIKSIVEMVYKVYSAFQMPVRTRLSTRPEKFMGDKHLWTKAETILKIIMDDKEYEISEGDGAFYGPKIDFIVKDSSGKEWQTATLQLDFQLPHNFELRFKNENNEEEEPVVIHRAIYGSFERFIGILLEHYKGSLPIWLAPTQAIILPISEKQYDYASKVLVHLLENNIRTSSNMDGGTLGNRIRQAEEMKIPLMIIVGEKEATTDQVALRYNKTHEICHYKQVAQIIHAKEIEYGTV